MAHRQSNVCIGERDASGKARQHTDDSIPCLFLTSIKSTHHHFQRLPQTQFWSCKLLWFWLHMYVHGTPACYTHPANRPLILSNTLDVISSFYFSCASLLLHAPPKRACHQGGHMHDHQHPPRFHARRSLCS